MSDDTRLVIFDCDGTLVDSQHIIHAAMVHAYEAHDLMPPAREETLRVVGLSLVQAIQSLSPEFNISQCEAVGESYKQSFATLRQDATLTEPMFAGASDILASLHADEEMVLGLATGKSRKGVDSFINREGLHGVFETIQTADDALSKPHPMMLEQALEETGMAAGASVMVGDTTFDMEMAVNAGVKAIGVAWGYHTEDELHRAGASIILRDFSELQNIL